MSVRVSIRDGRMVRTVPPGELLAELALGPPRASGNSMGRPGGPRARRRGPKWTHGRLRRALILPIALISSLGLGVAAWASHGSPFINLTVASASVSHNGAIWLQGGNPAGTGQFDPFLTLSPGGSANTEKGYNTIAANGEFDTFFGGGRTHPLAAAAIPTVTVGGVVYREFSLDANDTGSDDFMSIDQFKVFLDNQNDLTTYNVATASFGSDDGTAATLIYDMDAGAIGDVTALMRSQGLTPGSGVSDITVLVPDSLFPANCFYGSTTCGKWVYLFNSAGGYTDTGADPVSGTQNWNVTAGFEEWRTRLVPVVNVTKTANTSYTQPYDWTVDKKVKVSGTCVDPATVNLFDGESHDAEWCVTPTRTLGTARDPIVSGTVTVTNPTGGAVIGESIDAVVTNLTDVITQGATTTPVTLSCPVTFPKTLKATQSFTCTYSTAVPNTDTGTNTASATVTGAAGPYTGSAVVDFTSATVTTVDATATLTDLEGPLNQAASSGVIVTYVNTYSCNADEGTITNTATVKGDDSGSQHTDSAVLNVNCYSLAVTKDAATSRTRTWNWTIDKSVTPGTWNLFTGDSGTSQYTVTLTRTGFTDTAWVVSGNIHVSNAGNPIPATINSVSDVVSSAINATVSCGVSFPYTLAAGATLNCTYSATLPDGSTRTNTATAGQQLHNYDKNGVASNDGTKNYSGTASVNFSTATTTEVNAEVDVTDPSAGADPWHFAGSGSQTYTRTFTCDTDEGTHNNTATITQTGQSDSASVTVNCYEIAVTKDADTSFDRQYHWSIDKSSATTSLTLGAGETFLATYDVKVDMTGSTDSNQAVSGAIHVSNVGNPIAATINSVSDVVSPAIAASVSCGVAFPYTLAAGGTLNCTYSVALPDTTTRTNTATAVRQNYSYSYLLVATPAGTTSKSGTAAVDFAGATINQVDECVAVTDTFAGALGTVCFGVDALPKVFHYSRLIGPFDGSVCGTPINIDNTATFVANDTGATGSDGHRIVVTIRCGEGCTPGFWQGGLGVNFWDTANDSDWTAHGGVGTNPFTTTTTFTPFFQATGSAIPDSWNMLQIVGSGGTNLWPRKAARDLIAAYLNRSFGMAYPYSISTILSDWSTAIANGTSGYMTFHLKYDAANNLGCHMH